MPKRDEHLLLADIVDNIKFILTITKPYKRGIF